MQTWTLEVYVAKYNDILRDGIERLFSCFPKNDKSKVFKNYNLGKIEKQTAPHKVLLNSLPMNGHILGFYILKQVVLMETTL